MGLFSKLISLGKEISQGIQQVGREMESAQYRRDSGNMQNDYPWDNPKTESQFIDMVEHNFTRDYVIMENVTTQQLVGENIAATPYTLCFYRDNEPVLAIMFTEHNKEKNNMFKNAKMACENNNIKFLNFFAHFNNDEQYVVDRINNCLDQ